MKKLLLTSAIFLSACGNQNVISDSSGFSGPESVSAQSMDMARSKVASSTVMQENGAQRHNTKQQYNTASTSAPTATRQNTENPTSQSFLAYRYNYGFQLPAKSVAATSQSHADICLKAGPSKCQVLNSSTSAHNDTNVSAHLNLRAEPEWLETFSEQMQSSVKEAKGKITNSNVSAEDLTRQMLDTDARLKAQTTLRDRLQGLLATRNAELKDLLALERELARVQGQIESATTTLNVLRKRVSMSVVDINYQSQSVAISQNAFSPIGRALKNFVRQFSYGLSNVIEFFAGALPWLIFVILPGLWIGRRWWQGRKSPQKTKHPTADTKP